MRERSTLLLGLLAAASLLAGPQTSSTTESLSCGQGVEVQLNAPTATQGRLALVEVHSARPLAELSGSWAGQQLHFWQEANPARAHRALLGVDLEQAPGQFPVSLRGTLSDGERWACRARLVVERGTFALEELQVDQRFVELSARDRERAEREERRLREIFSGVTPERLWAGGFRQPLEQSEARGNFGVRRILNKQPRSPHGGEDFSAPAGTPVRAAQRGRVALAEDLYFSGKTVVLDHGLGLFTFYGHLESLAVEEGQMVEGGALLGRVGATGRVTGPHLHWAARLSRARVSPLDLLAVLPD